MSEVVPPESINFLPVIQCVDDPLVILSGTGVINFGNKAFCTMLDLPSEKIVAEPFYSIRHHLFDHPIIRENLYFLFSNSERSIVFDLPQIIPPFQGKNIRVRAEILEKCKTGDIHQILLLFNDITEIIAAELTIRQKTLNILELTTPVTKIWDQILIFPMIGTIDPNRAHKLTEQLLMKIRQEDAKFVIIDGSSVSEMNKQVVIHILNAISAINLLGAKVLLTGLKPDLALLMAENGVDMQNITCKVSLPEGIKHALAALGYSISHESTAKNREPEHGLSYSLSRSPLRVIYPLFGKT